MLDVSPGILNCGDLGSGAEAWEACSRCSTGVGVLGGGRVWTWDGAECLASAVDGKLMDVGGGTKKDEERSWQMFSDRVLRMMF